ncbi:MAG: LamG-like jellyroll fold domain-containing protein, partial [Bacillota bacterium]
WIYKTTNDAWQNIISGDDFNHLLLVNAGQIKIGHNALNSFADPDSISNDQWYFVVSTFDYDTGDLKLYKDGAYVGGVVIPEGERAMTDPTLWVGRYSGGASWRGRIDDARVFDFALTPEQIAQMYSSGAGDSRAITTGHTVDGQTWRAEVTPFSATAAGNTYASNEVVIGEPALISIMPLGDSITVGVGSTDQTGYRRELYQQLTDSGYNVDFVGTQNSGIPSDFDKDHEGHSGWRADQIRDNIYNWLVANHADIVLLHIGTNDIQGDNEDVDEVEAILDEINRYEDTYSKNVTVLVARIILRDDTKSDQTVAFNNAVEAMVMERIAAGDNLVMVDQENALVYPGDLADSVHPNDSGYSKMASTWFNSLNLLLGLDMTAYSTLSLSSNNYFLTTDLILAYMFDGDAITAEFN